MLRSVLLLGLLASLAVAVWVSTRPVRRGPALAAAEPRGNALASSLVARLSPPPGYLRAALPDDSFGAYLRALPLRPDGAPVRLHDGRLKGRQDVHAAVVALQVGPRDLQQCADSVMRLRAEHLYAVGRADDIAFHFTSGFRCEFARWKTGERPRASGADVAWIPGGARDGSATALQRYLDVVYTYGGTRSLPRDLERVVDPRLVEAGDVYLRAGSPGHAMLVVDVAVAGASRALLLVQGYMPAQEIHVVRNLEVPARSPWFLVGEGRALVTPEWTCGWGDLWRFPEPR